MKLVFYKPIKFQDKLIAWYTKGPYYHAEIEFSDGMRVESSAESNGVSIYTPKEDNYITVKFNILNANEDKVRKWCEEQMGCKYDWFGVVRFVVPFVKQSSTRWFCSELIVAALQQIGFFANVKPHKLSPNDMFKVCANSKNFSLED